MKQTKLKPTKKENLYYNFVTNRILNLDTGETTILNKEVEKERERYKR